MNKMIKKISICLLMITMMQGCLLSNTNDDEKIMSNKKEIIVEDALDIALKHAIVSKEDAMILKIAKDDHEFEIQFRVDHTNYSYDIDQYGNILDFDKVSSKSKDLIYTRPTYYYSGASRYYYSGATSLIDPEDMISEDEVERLVFEHAGVNEDNARIIKFKRDDYRYKLDFMADNH